MKKTTLFYLLIALAVVFIAVKYLPGARKKTSTQDPAAENIPTKPKVRYRSMSRPILAGGDTNLAYTI